MALEDYKKNSLSASHIYEEEKYLTLEAYCEKRGSRVTPQALVYGSLGAIVQEKQKVSSQAHRLRDKPLH